MQDSAYISHTSLTGYGVLTDAFTTKFDTAELRDKLFLKNLLTQKENGRTCDKVLPFPLI